MRVALIVTYSIFSLPGIDVKQSVNAFTQSMSSVHKKETDIIRCYAWCMPADAFCGRVVDMDSYLHLNRRVLLGLDSLRSFQVANDEFAYKPYEPISGGKQRAFVGMVIYYLLMSERSRLNC